MRWSLNGVRSDPKSGSRLLRSLVIANGFSPCPATLSGDWTVRKVNARQRVIMKNELLRLSICVPLTAYPLSGNTDWGIYHRAIYRRLRGVPKSTPGRVSASCNARSAKRLGRPQDAHLSIKAVSGVTPLRGCWNHVRDMG